MNSRAVTFLLLVPLSVFGCAKADYSQPAMKEAATEGMAVTDSSGSMAVADAAVPMPTEAVFLADGTEYEKARIMHLGQRRLGDRIW
jgi:hypothetical protein